MNSFHGSTIVKLDISGRLKLPPGVVTDFKSVDPTGRVFLKYMPERMVSIRPANKVPSEPPSDSAEKDYDDDAETRIRLRQISLLSNYDTISPQGRVTLPQSLLELIDVKSGQNVVLVGFGLGYEIWKPETLAEEMRKELEQRHRKYEQTRDKVTE